MRRCLRGFLIGLITLSLLSAPAHACWRSRQARRCRAATLPACQPATVAACCDPCGEVGVVQSCAAATACCAAEESVGGAATAAEAESVRGETGGASGSQAAAGQPTLAPVAGVERPQPGLEPIVSPPTLEPAGAGVTPASNEQPLAERPFGDAASVPAAPPGQPGVVTEPAPEPEFGEPPLQAGVGGVDGLDAAPAVEEPAPSPEATDLAPMPAEEPPVQPPVREVVPEAAAPTPQPAPEAAPAPEAGNIFDEVDGQEAGGERVDEGAAAPVPDNAFGEPGGESSGESAVSGDPLDGPAADPASASDPFGDPAADPFAGGDAGRPEAGAEEQEMAEPAPAGDADPLAEPGIEPATPVDEAPAADEAAPAGVEPADPFAGNEPLEEQPEPTAPADEPAEPAVPAAPTEPSEPAAPVEPADEVPVVADPFAAGEPLRRWIDATGTASIVGTLIDVGGDGRCVLDVRGRRIVVPLRKLSPHDRDYVHQAGVRLAKNRSHDAGDTAAAAGPAATDTAGL